MKVAPDYLARLDGAADVLWEPLWRLRTGLRPVERALLTCPPVRRLHFVHHGGGSCLSTPHTHSRLQHTLGVFALIAHFCPDDDVLRAAALLHDVGHAPFCHTLEGLDGVDHHCWTGDRVLSPPVADILIQHSLDPRTVLACISGEPVNLLRNNDGILHADHLDCWVRSAQVGGILPRPAPEILARLCLQGPYLDTDVETAELLVDLIVAEARFYCTAANLGPNTILKHLVQQLLDAGVLTTKGLYTMTDSMVERALFDTLVTAAEARRLWYQTHAIRAHRLGDNEPPLGAHVVQMDHLYLAMPLANGQSVTRVSSRAGALAAEAQELHGAYVVYWDGYD
jgi:HD superfamily phosphohydrolase